MILKKVIDYFFCKPDKEELENAILLLTKEEQELFLSQSDYDKLHSLNVYKGVKEKKLPTIYLKLALLHDIGKENVNFLVRVLHKLGFNTSIKYHAKKGADKLKNIDVKLSYLISIHHNIDVDENMKKFQGVDDVN